MKRKPWKSVYRNALQLLLVGAVTGISVGVVVTLYNLLFSFSEEFARFAYDAIRNNPIWLLVWAAALCVTVFMIASAVQASKIIKGCGVPMAEGATGGVVRLRWWRDATLMFAVTIVEVFMGLSIGAEGSSILIGASVGDGVSSGLRRNFMIRRYQVTGGACAGLAVASNAPLTGIVFAFEEAHKRFTPEVFITAFASVVFAVLTRTLLFLGMGMQDKLTSNFTTFSLPTQSLPLEIFPFVLIAAVVCGGLGVVAYKGVFGVRKLFHKIAIKNGYWRDVVKVAIAVVLGGVISLLAADTMGSGHHLIEGLGYSSTHSPSFFGVPFVWALVIIALLKWLATCLNIGAGIPCGIFVPIIAVGACVGAALNQGFVAMNMDSQFCDLIVLICMATFFATIVKAPLTAIIMVCEFTGSFTPLLPVVIGVSVGYLIGNVTRTGGIYEELLEVYEQEEKLHEALKEETFEVVVAAGSLADKREIKTVLWPSNARVITIQRDGKSVVPEGQTVLQAGDALTIICKTEDKEVSRDDLSHIVGA